MDIRLVLTVRILTLVAILLLLDAPMLGAQQCTPPKNPYFDFQVEQPATFIADSTVSPRPAETRAGRAQDVRTLVSFIVDSLGVPETRSFKLLRASDAEVARRAKEVFARWRYSPARVGGCRVPQLVQTEVVP